MTLGTVRRDWGGHACTVGMASMTFGDCAQGLGRTCMYCGDGINDLAALAAADVGMAIGSSDASAAAFVSDKHTSVSGTGCVALTEVCTPTAVWGG